MQFINNGPDIPERLLQAHEEGQVIFFCGAGISYPAGLPGFSGLVNKIYEELSIEPTAVQKLAIKAKQFDTAISLIESDVTDGREKVRSALSTILKPNLSTHKSTATHEAILDLSKNRNGLTRLITTNFDRIFEEIKNKKAIPIPTFKSPFLPIPKIQWNGIIYLHGLLPENYSKDELNNLIISSGDFGLAYLTDRWAARFISTLFRNYTICFVGYSINDPVLRYMMDALAADRLMGESSPEMFAFGSYSKGKKEDSENEWKAKNVTPILYKEYRHHFYLHKTLHEWAKVYRSGASGKELIVTETALFQPVESTKQDNYINRMLWALSDPSGLPAKRFAELEPVPELSWLEKLNKKSYRHENLTMFGVSPKHEVDRETTFWFFDRPTPYYLAPSMSITATTHQPGKFDKVMRQMALWLARHLNDPKLILWLINQGPFIHPEFRKIIENQIEKLDALSKSNDNEKIEELARIKKYAPNAIPNQAMKIIWRLLLDRQVKFHNEEISIFRWIEQFKIDGMTTSTRLALRETIKPCVSLNRPLVWDNNKENKTPERIAEIVKWEIVLASDHVRYALDKLSDDINWKKSIPYLLGDFNMLLEDALNLSKLLGEANTKHDCTYIYQPSISNHIQNKGHQDWTILIDLVRDSWLATAKLRPERAKTFATLWSQGPYPIFHRLAFFASTQLDIIPPNESMSWLLVDGNSWLWAKETQREAMRLIVYLATRLDKKHIEKLEESIISGPPKILYKDHVNESDWDFFSKKEVWLRLMKLKDSGAIISQESQDLLNSISDKYQFKLMENEREEFPFWMDIIQTIERHPWKTYIPIPKTKEEIFEYLIEHPTMEDTQRDDWRQLCSEKFNETAYVLRELSTQENLPIQKRWPISRWRDAIQAWTGENLRLCSWNDMAPIVAGAPEELYHRAAIEISWWVNVISERFEKHSDSFFEISRRILSMNFDNIGTDISMSLAINHPIGIITQALLDWYYSQDPNDNQKLPELVGEIFTELCDTKIMKFKYGRLQLATHAIPLFRSDKEWTKRYLIPLFDWNKSEIEAKSAWLGFLYSPRNYIPFMELIKSYFLETVNHYSDLGQIKERFAAFFTIVSLNPGYNFTIKELRSAMNAFPEDGLRESAMTLVKSLESANNNRVEYWKNKILPFWKKVWPKSNDKVFPSLSEPLALLCIEAGPEFSSAVEVLSGSIHKTRDPYYIIHRLSESNLSSQFPEHALRLLFSTIKEDSRWISADKLRQCLNTIIEKRPDFRENPMYQKLDLLTRKLEI